MTEDDAIRMTRDYIESLFPRRCPSCGRLFETLRDYLELTSHLESPILWDDIDDGIPEDPVGPMSFANCRCGTTLIVASLDMPPDLRVALMTWARSECLRRSITISALLHEIRDRIDTQVLAAGVRT